MCLMFGDVIVLSFLLLRIGGCVLRDVHTRCWVMVNNRFPKAKIGEAIADVYETPTRCFRSIPFPYEQYKM